MDGMRERDEPAGRWVNASDPEFPAVAADNGDRAVRRFKAGCVLEAEPVWADVFVPKHDVIPGSDGNEWALQKEFTFDLWVDVL